MVLHDLQYQLLLTNVVEPGFLTSVIIRYHFIVIIQCLSTDLRLVTIRIRTSVWIGISPALIPRATNSFMALCMTSIVIVFNSFDTFVQSFFFCFHTQVHVSEKCYISIIIFCPNTHRISFYLVSWDYDVANDAIMMLALT